MSEGDDQSMLNSLGGETGCRRLAQGFYGRVAASAELKPLFPGKSLRCATEEFAAFLIQFLDGDEGQTQYRWWLSLRESHARFTISERQRTTWLGLMSVAIESVVEDPVAGQALKEFFGVASLHIVGSDESPLQNSELAKRWDQQRALDQLVSLLEEEKDAEAINLACHFAARRSVFVGLLARMMATGRLPLVGFVVASIQQDKDLAIGRFNGRTLLHFAARSSCIPVVRQLLADGTDPNVLDGGGHTPLYRAAGSASDQGPAIVHELVLAGATVDLCRGVNRSTPLHEAARHGNLAVAEALLKAGASVHARDKKGFTPLDRAINCRRSQVAELLRASKRF